MLTYICVVVSFLIYKLSTNEGLAFSRLVFLHFLALKASYLIVAQSPYLMSTPTLFGMYCIIQLALIKKAKCKDKSQFAILTLILISLGYNMLTISQYVMVTYGFYGAYKSIIGSIMIIELLLLSWNVKYVAHYRKQYRDTYTNFIDRLFRVRGWLSYRKIL